MSFIGIITNSKNEEYMIKMLSNKFPIENIIFITDKNIDNIKNIRFETVIVDCRLKNCRYLKSIISNSKYVILNADLTVNSEIFEDLNLTIVTYGFNNKATFTISSVSENYIIICLQRIIKSVSNKKYEPQEIELKLAKNIDIHAIMSAEIMLLIY